MMGNGKASTVGARELRQRTVKRFLEDYESEEGAGRREAVDGAIRHLYSPDLNAGWGIHVVQEVQEEGSGRREADGDCLFTAARKAMMGNGKASTVGARELRQRTVKRFLEDYESEEGAGRREAVDGAIRHLYSPDLNAGWGIHVVQEVQEEGSGRREADGDCLFTAARKAMMGNGKASTVGARELRQRTVKRFLEDYESEEGAGRREAVDGAIRHLYSPDLNAGWGIHVVQEVKLLAMKADREALDSAIQELVDLGLQRFRCMDQMRW